MSYLMIDLRKTAVKKWAKHASDAKLVLFSKNKKKLKQARRLAHAKVCDVSGKKLGKTLLRQIADYLSHHSDAQLTVFTRNKKLAKRCQKLQARYPDAQLVVLKTLPVYQETSEANDAALEIVETEAQVEDEAPAEAATAVDETSAAALETTEEAQAESESPAEANDATLEIVETEAPAVETREAIAAPIESTPPAETLVFTMETEVFAETAAPVAPALLDAQAVIKKNKPKKKQPLVQLLAQTLHLDIAVAQDLVQQLQTAGNIKIDAAENIKYCS